MERLMFRAVVQLKTIIIIIIIIIIIMTLTTVSTTVLYCDYFMRGDVKNQRVL